MNDIITITHDKDHPFSMISNSLIRNSNVSREARMILIICLSYKSLKNWKICIPALMRQESISKTKMYKIIDELLTLGYMKRTSFLEKGMKRYRYQVSEEPIFKKSLPCPKNQDTEKQDSKERKILRKPFIPLKGTISSVEWNKKCLDALEKWTKQNGFDVEYCIKKTKGKTRYRLRCNGQEWLIKVRSISPQNLLKKIEHWNESLKTIYRSVNQPPLNSFVSELEAYLRKNGSNPTVSPENRL